MTNKEKFLALVSDDTNNTMDYLRERIEKRAQLRESQAIAYKVIDKLNELGWSQKELAKKLDVSPQQVNKIVKGKENMTVSTLVKLQEILSMPILASFYETSFENATNEFSKSWKSDYQQPVAPLNDEGYTKSIKTKIIHLQNTQNMNATSFTYQTA